MTWETGVDIYTLLILCIKSTASEDLLYSTGHSTQCSVVKLLGRKSKKRGYMCVYIYDWFTLLNSRNGHSSVKQLYSNK